MFGGENMDPAEGLSLAAFSSLLGLTEDAVKSKELAGKFLSMRRPNSGGAREYPAFQAWRGIRGRPLESVLEALGHPPGPQAYAFFTSPQDNLCGLTPIEILQGFSPGETPCIEILECLAKSPWERLEIVLSAARAYSHALRA